MKFIYEQFGHYAGVGEYYMREKYPQEIIIDVCKRLKRLEMLIDANDYHFETKEKLVKNTKDKK